MFPMQPGLVRSGKWNCHIWHGLMGVMRYFELPPGPQNLSNNVLE